MKRTRNKNKIAGESPLFIRIIRIKKISELSKRHFVVPVFLFGLIIACFAGQNDPPKNAAIAEFEPALAVAIQDSHIGD
jgi:hypothetical protein